MSIYRMHLLADPSISHYESVYYWVWKASAYLSTSLWIVLIVKTVLHGNG